MSLFLLDTDSLSLFQQGKTAIFKAVEDHRTIGHVVGTTIVTVEEQFSGWLAAARTARTPPQVAKISALFASSVEFLRDFSVFPQTEASLARFEQLVRLKLNVGRMDLRIASIAHELGATVVTRNHRDFARVPGLASSDWTT